MAQLNTNQKIIADDVLRYKKNKLASTLALLGLVFNCLYFMVLYCISNREFYKILIGLSVVINLVVLLGGFLASEGVKNYKKSMAIVLLVIAAIQIARIFVYPVQILNFKVAEGSTFYGMTGAYYFGADLTTKSTSAILIVYLALSAACFVAAAVWGFIVSLRLENFNRQLEKGEVDIDKTLKEMDAEDERQTSNVISEATISETEKHLVEEDKNA